MASAIGPAASVVPTDDPVALAAAITATLREGRNPEPLAAQTFDDVARSHLRTFEEALARRSGAR
jgi:hypothetical protein